MKRILLLAAAAALSCVDFSTALSECEATGRCDGAALSDSGAILPPFDAGGGAVDPDSGTPDAGCQDADGDGMGVGCALPDCDEGDPLRPNTFACRLGTYVCRSCPGSSDSNSGEPGSPLRTIGQGIDYARALDAGAVYVANANRYTTAVYDEDVDMVAGVSVIGRYYVDDGGWRYPSAARTTIHTGRAQGLYFGPGISRETTLSGFRVRVRGGDGGVNTGVTIFDSSPTLDDVAAGYPLFPGERTVGIRIEGDGGSRPSPLILRSAAYSLANATESTGVLVINAAPDIRFTTAYGGAVQTGGTANGLRMDNAAGTSVTDSAIIGCIGMPPAGIATASCEGVFSAGDVSGAFIGSSEICGCYDYCAATGGGTAVAITACGEYDGGAPMTVAGNTVILGAAINSNSGAARGMRVRDQCTVDILDNPQIQAAETAGGSAVGVNCVAGALGPARCTIQRNRIFSHRLGAPTFASAVACGCATCDGGCLEVSDNELDVYGGVAPNPAYYSVLLVDHSSPYVARNRIGLSTLDATCQVGRGVLLQDSDALVENNFIRGGSCGNSIGLLTVTTRPSQGPLVTSNTIIGGESNAQAGMGIYGVVTNSAGPSGRYYNNIITTGPTNAASVRGAAMFEGAALPLEMYNNLLWAANNGAEYTTGWATPGLVYRSAAQLNAEPYAGDNFTAAPFLVSWRDPHLMPQSPAIDAGTFTNLPLDDIDKQKRPLPDAGVRPSVGADQL